MLMQKGPLPKYLVHLLQPLMTWHGVYSKSAEASSSFGSFFVLPDSVRDTVREITQKSSWGQAEVYTSGGQFFVFGSNYRLSPKKELYYPLRVDGEFQQAMLAEAREISKDSILRFLWRDKEGRVGMCFVPIIGIIALSSSRSMAAVPELAYGMALLGIFALVFVPVYGYFKRNQFRKALGKIWNDPQLPSSAGISKQF